MAILQGYFVSYVCAPFMMSRSVSVVAVDHGALRAQPIDIRALIMRISFALLCDKVVTLTDRTLADYYTLFPFSKSKFRRIYNWIDTQSFHSPAYDLLSTHVLSAGAFSPEKGFEQLLDAFAPVAKARPDWPLDLWGDGPLRGELEERARRLGIASQVRFMGMRNDLAEHYQDYAMYVLPSYREGLPLVLLEAKACRLPIVSFDVITGPREIVRDGVDGFLVEPRNIPALSEKILLLIDNPALRQRMSDRTQEDLERFSKETILQQWISLIEEL